MNASTVEMFHYFSQSSRVVLIAGIIFLAFGFISAFEFNGLKLVIRDNKTIIALCVGILLVLLSVIMPEFNIRELCEARDSVKGSITESQIASQNCRGDSECDKHTYLSNKLAVDAMNNLQHLVSDSYRKCP